MKKEKCPMCNGSGKTTDPDGKRDKCEGCGGSGKKEGYDETAKRNGWVSWEDAPIVDD